MNEKDEWKGWTLATDDQGGLFYYHAKMEISQWEMPEDLESTLGIWEYVLYY